MSWLSKAFRQKRFKEPTTWVGISAILYGAKNIFAGAGTTTPAILGQASEAAAQVGEAVTTGVDPLTASIMVGLGILMANTETAPDTPILRVESENKSSD